MEPANRSTDLHKSNLWRVIYYRGPSAGQVYWDMAKDGLYQKTGTTQILNEKWEGLFSAS